MKNDFWGKKILLTAVLAVLLIACAACGNDGEILDNEDQVAGASSKVIYGYLRELDQQENTALVEIFTIISENDNAALEKLNDPQSKFYNGYFLSHQGKSLVLPLADQVDLRLSDFDYHSSGYYLDRYGMRNAAEWLEAQEGGEIDRDQVNRTAPNNAGIDEQKKDTAFDNSSVDNREDLNNRENLDNKENIDNRENRQLISDNKAYSGNELAYLAARIQAYEYIPFCFYLENSRIIRIIEMDTIYR